MTFEFITFTTRFILNHWFSTGRLQHVSQVGHERLCTLKMGLHAE